MRLFGRQNGEDGTGGHGTGGPGDRVSAFWAWWQQARPRVDSLVAADDILGFGQLVDGAVLALHPDLKWELAPGKEAAHALVVTAAGDAELRPLAHRWAAAAPEGDLLWEFHPSRQADPRATERTVNVDGETFKLDKLTLGLRVPRDGSRVDVSAYHPAFADLDEDDRLEGTLIALDWLLGEDEVARWVGEITPVTFEPIDAVAAAHLPAVVADLAADLAPGAGEEQWALLEGRTGRGAPLTATARHPLRPVDHPLFDRHVEITLPYRHRDEGGLPAGDSLAALRAFEERLSAGLLDRRETALLAAHVSAEGLRVFHVYADPEGDAAAWAKELAKGWNEGKARVAVTEDPAWTAVAPFLT
ncbi:DUF695 domain-containing protein [Nonomuraea rhodomycinica]|uniref:DUF695 domain-containing protein n=1 Tax=Nonomuraea rhodomycinica TaxID=1712872 RepID=A0A7Y6ME59_9ACTN|nr:DUF695 domain-containing protein [Nonomuraea rhodomycinica]NUW45243.1 DUF695 domain-containing protein [Nonomuraea rhodomycinica]